MKKSNTRRSFQEGKLKHVQCKIQAATVDANLLYIAGHATRHTHMCTHTRPVLESPRRWELCSIMHSSSSEVRGWSCVSHTINAGGSFCRLHNGHLADGRYATNRVLHHDQRAIRGCCPHSVVEIWELGDTRMMPWMPHVICHHAQTNSVTTH